MRRVRYLYGTQEKREHEAQHQREERVEDRLGTEQELSRTIRYRTNILLAI